MTLDAATDRTVTMMLFIAQRSVGRSTMALT